MSGAIPFVSSKGARVLAEAIRYRVFAAIPVVCSPGIYHKAYTLRKVLFQSFLTEPVSPLTTWDWICSMPSRRRKILIRAFRKREELGERSRNYSIIKAFVKIENLPYFRQTEDGYEVFGTEYVARLIQAPNDETHLDAGPFLKPLVPALKRDWSSRNWLFYASVAPEKLDEWLNTHRGAVSWFWSDYSSFDATYTAETWAMVESFYSIIYPDAPDDFWAAIEAWRQPVGRIHCRKDNLTIRYRAPVCNASGRDDTALANALVNGIVLALSFAAALSGKTVMQLTESDVLRASGRVNIAVVGDDSLVACDFDVQPLLPMVERGIRGFGLSAKVQSSPHLCDVTFLGMMPYPVGSRLFWGPTIGRRLYKAYWQAEPVGNLPAWTNGVAKQMSLMQHVPILADIADQVLHLLRGAKITEQAVDPNRVWAARTAACPRWDVGTVNWLCRRYRAQGLTQSQVLADLEVVRGITRLPAIVRLHTTDAALAADDL